MSADTIINLIEEVAVPWFEQHEASLMSVMVVAMGVIEKVADATAKGASKLAMIPDVGPYVVDFLTKVGKVTETVAASLKADLANGSVTGDIAAVIASITNNPNIINNKWVQAVVAKVSCFKSCVSTPVAVAPAVPAASAAPFALSAPRKNKKACCSPRKPCKSKPKVKPAAKPKPKTSCKPKYKLSCVKVPPSPVAAPASPVAPAPVVAPTVPAPAVPITQ